MNMTIVNMIARSVKVPTGKEVTAIAISHGGGSIMIQLDHTEWYYLQQNGKLDYTKYHPVDGFIQVYRNRMVVYSGAICRIDEGVTYENVMRFADTYNRQSA